MNYEAAMIVVTRPGHFNPMDIDAACNFIVNNQPPAHIRCDHDANVRQARVVCWGNHVAYEVERSMQRHPRNAA